MHIMSCCWVVIFEEMTERNGNQIGPYNYRVDELESENTLFVIHYVCGNKCVGIFVCMQTRV